MSTRDLLVRCEEFIAGFEDDDDQQGIPELLADLRAALADDPTIEQQDREHADRALAAHYAGPDQSTAANPANPAPSQTLK